MAKRAMPFKPIDTSGVGDEPLDYGEILENILHRDLRGYCKVDMRHHPKYGLLLILWLADTKHVKECEAIIARNSAALMPMYAEYPDAVVKFFCPK